MRQRLQDWLTAQSERRPESTAIVYCGESTTYGALERQTNQLARALKAAGCVRGDRVGLMLTKSPRALAAMLGVLKADCIYVPIDITSPVSRIERILGQCECRLVLGEQSTAALLTRIAQGGRAGLPPAGWMDGNAGHADAVRTAFRRDEIDLLDSAPVDSRNDSTAAAHILFTSGSTGAPKGVVITHANVLHFVNWAVGHFGIGPEDRVSGHPPLHFDLSTFDIYGTIASGAQIHLVPPELNLLPARLAEFIREARLTQWFSAPSALLPLARLDLVRHNDFPTLRRLLWCGEKFPVPALIYWMRRLPQVDFANLYGPTEATIASSFYHVRTAPSDEKAEIPIGTPCGGESLHVLDENLRPSAPGKVGELYIGGVGLSPGYWKDPLKTRAVFVSNPFAAEGADRIYRTGDLARVDRDGMIYLIGRADSQIKLRGHRIELGEIEAALHATAGIVDAAVVAIDSAENSEKVICCAYVSSPGSDLSPLNLKKKVSELLPRYMIPTRWKTLEQMPRNGNGKTDRASLKQQFSQDAELRLSEEAPAPTALEIPASEVRS